LEPHRNSASAQLESVTLRRHFQIAENRKQFYRQINTEKLGCKPSSKADQDAWIRIKLQKLRLINTIQMNPEERTALHELIDGLEQRYATNLEKSLEIILQSIPDSANELGKPSPQIIFENDEILLNSDGQTLVEPIFVHLLSHSIHHGIVIQGQR
jgi:hypothetical protein